MISPAVKREIERILAEQYGRPNDESPWVEAKEYGSPGITGEITRFDAPSEVPVGNEINFRVDGNLYDPTRSPTAMWNWVLAAKGNGRRDYAVGSGLGTAIGPEAAPTLRLGAMPNTPVTIELRLYGNSSWLSTWTGWDAWPD